MIDVSTYRDCANYIELELLADGYNAEVYHTVRGFPKVEAEYVTLATTAWDERVMGYLGDFNAWKGIELRPFDGATASGGGTAYFWRFEK